MFASSKCKRAYIKSFEYEKADKLINDMDNQALSESSHSDFPLDIDDPHHKSKPSNVPTLKLNKILNDNREYFVKDLKKLNSSQDPSSIHKNQSFDCNSMTNSIEEWDWEECQKQNESERNESCGLSNAPKTPPVKLSTQQKEDRDIRIAKLLSEGNSESYQLLKEINKIQELAASFVRNNSKKHQNKKL